MDPMIEVLDTRLLRLIPDDAQIERIAGGFAFTEGPLWRGDHLLFSDIPNNRIVRWEEGPEGPSVSTFRTPSGRSNGLTLDKQGRLIACEHQGRRVSITQADGSVELLAEYYDGKRLNSPNDVAIRSDGIVYFTDPPYGLLPWPGSGDAEIPSEIGFNGLYRVLPDGTVELLADDFVRPNGLAFSVDESILYVDDTHARHIRAFDVAADGSLSNDRVFFTYLGVADEHGPDGMKIDVEGNLWVTGPGSTWVVSAEGEALGRIRPPEHPANLAFGGSDWKTLFMTADTSVYRLRVNVAGIAVP